jgi:hypothetical protein
MIASGADGRRGVGRRDTTRDRSLENCQHTLGTPITDASDDRVEAGFGCQSRHTEAVAVVNGSGSGGIDDLEIDAEL